MGPVWKGVTRAACSAPAASGLAALTVLLGGERTEAQEVRSSAFIPAALEASVRDARICPDGALVVFAAEREASGTVELFSVPLNGGRSPIHIGGPLVPSGGYRWEIDPDGRRVVYVGPHLSSVALDGASRPVRLDDPAATTRDFVLVPDGSRVVYRAAPAGRYAGLFSVAVDGSALPIELVAPNDIGEVEHAYQVSPDGDSVVFVSHHEDGSVAQLYSARVHGGPVVSLDRPRFGIHTRISPAGDRVVYRCSRDASGNSELYAVPVDGSLEPSKLDVPLDASLVQAGDVKDFEVRLDGSWVVYLADRGNGRNALFGVPADGSAAPIELGGDVTSSFQIHPAGHLVLHAADREQDENFELRGVAIDGSAPPFPLSEAIPTPGHVGWFGVTADGTRIVYQAHHGEGGRVSDLWQVSLDTLVRTRIAATGAGRDFRISPDGRRVFYRDENFLYGLALDGISEPVSLSSALAPGEFWTSPDGSRVLYLTRDEGANEYGLASVHADGGPPIRLLAPRGAGSGGAPPGTQAFGAGGGFRDFSFGTSGVTNPTGEKPESKLWVNDGSWWGSLYNDAAQDYHIYRLDASTQRWVDTGTVLDDRATTNADVLWDGASQKLYVASHVFTTASGPTASGWCRLLRFSYSSATKTYARDPGFPVDITRGSAEALTIAKDSQGRLWATWVESSEVMVNHSLASDSSWRTPFVLPAGSVSTSPDDISSIIAFGGNRVGVMWSNQRTSSVYFAVHRDTEEGTVWQPEELVLPDAGCSGACADDHINLKADDGGRVFAVLKTSLEDPDQPQNLVVMRGPNGGWGSTTFGLVRDNHTRAILLLDEQGGEVHVFATAPTGGGIIYHKSAPLTDPRFAPGVGTPFIQSATDSAINDPTSTKQNLDSLTGLVVLAGDENTRYYLHNFLDLGSVAEPPSISAFTPTSGPVGTNVTITGTGFAGANGVRFNGTPAGFSVTSSTQIRATVPSGATTGRLGVSTPDGTATSSADFTVTQPSDAPTISSFSPTSGPVGANVTITGTGFAGANSVRFNGTPAGFSVTSSTQIRATVPSGATTGRISVGTPGGTATSAGAFTVTQPPSIHSFSPTSGPVGTSVTVTGAGFTRTTGVRFNGTAASFTVVSASQIRTTVPAAASSGVITVITPDGTASSASSFRVTQPPDIDALLPPLGFVLTPVTITGRHFTGATGVKFNGRSAQFTVLGDGLIATTVPIGASTGKISVTTPAGTGTSPTDFVVIGL